MDVDFLCQECGQTFNARWKLESHVKCKHDSKTYKCPKCGEEIIGKGNVENHLREHKTKTCGTCMVVMPLNSWSSHKANCSGNLLCCDKCSYTTKLKGSLKRHHASIHEPIKPKVKEEILHSCIHCKKSFKMRKHLTVHAPTKISHFNFIL